MCKLIITRTFFPVCSPLHCSAIANFHSHVINFNEYFRFAWCMPTILHYLQRNMNISRSCSFLILFYLLNCRAIHGIWLCGAVITQIHSQSIQNGLCTQLIRFWIVCLCVCWHTFVTKSFAIEFGCRCEMVVDASEM